jgi:glycosyltransferase involved in cell wall biosynthesis
MKPSGRNEGQMVGGDVGRFMDGLPFPFLASVVLGGSAFAASSVVHDKRPFVDAFAETLGKWRHPHRALWLSDTFFDRNGVSHVLQATLHEARAAGLPLDFLVCDELAATEPETKRPLDGPHLLRLPPSAHVALPFYQEQPLRLPDLMAVHRAFAEGGYDRIVCSTEAPMGLVALYLRSAFHVPAYFYVHTDWLDFAKRTLGLNPQQLDRLRRLLRAFYSRFDGVFVLNTEQRDFLTSPAMGLKPERVHVTAHWVDPVYRPVTIGKNEVFAQAAQAAGQSLKPGTKVMLFAGRLSFEKGLRDLPLILAQVRRNLPDTLLAVAGTGPAESWLREAIPDALMLGWQEKADLARIYSAADLLVLPSWFDTFSCVLLEALRCGLPALAYATKGPADILIHQVNGYLAKTPEEMGSYCVEYLLHPEKAATFRRAAAERGAQYEAEPILSDMLAALGLRGQSVAGTSLRATDKGQRAPGDPPQIADEEGILAQWLGLAG